jgi:SAM-dependent methyltransferase
MKKAAQRINRFVQRAREIVRSHDKGCAACGNCGFRGAPVHGKALWPELVRQWELTSQWETWFDQREGNHCAWCGVSVRSSQLAATIVQTANQQSGSAARNLHNLFKDTHTHSMQIAEINSAGDLHKSLARCPGLRYSEYGSKSAKVPSEDLTRLSYADASFDLVITSDTIEHVPDIHLALREIYRVLRPGAAHVFTTPVIWDRPTRQRAVIRNGELVHLMAPSYHGGAQDNKTDFLVFYEFGADFPDVCHEAGFELDMVRDNSNPALVTFIARKPV